MKMTMVEGVNKGILLFGVSEKDRCESSWIQVELTRVKGQGSQLACGLEWEPISFFWFCLGYSINFVRASMLFFLELVLFVLFWPTIVLYETRRWNHLSRQIGFKALSVCGWIDIKNTSLEILTPTLFPLSWQIWQSFSYGSPGAELCPNLNRQGTSVKALQVSNPMYIAAIAPWWQMVGSRSVNNPTADLRTFLSLSLEFTNIDLVCFTSIIPTWCAVTEFYSTGLAYKLTVTRLVMSSLGLGQVNQNKLKPISQ